MPKFSIITICFNAGEALRRTIESVNEQTYPDVEHVIIDGGSSDVSVDLIKNLARRNVRWVSERDEGIADAFNKGTVLTQGNYICYLNAGDAFVSPQVLALAATQIKQDDPKAAAIFYGDFISASHGVQRIHRTSSRVEDFAWDNPINHQSAFVPRTLAIDYPYDKRLVLGMDYEFWLRLIKVAEFKKLDFPVAIFELGGRSSTPRWEVHNLFIHRALWHINRGTRVDLSDIAKLAVRALRFKLNHIVRLFLGKSISRFLRAAKSRRLERKNRPAIATSV